MLLWFLRAVPGFSVSSHPHPGTRRWRTETKTASDVRSLGTIGVRWRARG